MRLTPRQSDILDQTRSVGRVTVDGLSCSFGMTKQTIRRDLNDLCNAGFLVRVHGGAMLPSGTSNIAYEERRRVAAEVKDAIAACAAQMVSPGASLVLTIGTTTEAVARHLLKTPELMVLTNNLNVAQTLSRHPSADVIMTGGRLRATDGGLVGDMAAQTVQNFKLDLAIIGTSAIDQNGDLLDFDPEEVRVSQVILERARHVILVADATKLTRQAPVKIATLARVDHWITDTAPPPALARLCRNAKTQITIAEHAR